eukprot:scaffold214903_cov17-Prasinocladus_malaysianus.AAC.1
MSENAERELLLAVDGMRGDHPVQQAVAPYNSDICRPLTALMGQMSVLSVVCTIRPAQDLS